MSESRPAFRFTQGEWAKHRTSDMKPFIVGDDTGNPWISCSAWLSSGDKIIAEVWMRTSTPDGGFPTVDNIPEMKANLALMSAAPNYHEAVADALEEYRVDPEIPFSPDTMNKLKAAFAKATTY